MEEEELNVISAVIEALNTENMWFTQKTDPTFEEPSSYYSLNIYGEPDSDAVKQIAKEVIDLIGDGAVDINTAIELWITDKLSEYKLDYKDNLITKFEPKPVVDGIEAYENSVQLAENKKIVEDTEYDEYIQQENQLKATYKDRVKKNVTPEVINSFNDLKDILDTETKDTNVDGFYFPSKAVAIISMSNRVYNLNPYMDLTISNILNMVDDNETVYSAIDDLFNEYKADSAFTWADNLISVLSKLDFDVVDVDNDLDESNAISNKKCKLDEVNSKSDNIINKMITDNNFDSNSKEGQIIIRTQNLFNVLSDAGYNVDVAFDNGESTNSIQLGTLGGKVVITITDTDKPLRAFLSGNFEITDDNLKQFKDIQNQVSVL